MSFGLVIDCNCLFSEKCSNPNPPFQAKLHRQFLLYFLYPNFIPHKSFPRPSSINFECVSQDVISIISLSIPNNAIILSKVTPFQHLFYLLIGIFLPSFFLGKIWEKGRRILLHLYSKNKDREYVSLLVSSELQMPQKLSLWEKWHLLDSNLCSCTYAQLRQPRKIEN